MKHLRKHFSLQKIYQWYEKNLSKIILLSLIHVISTFIVSLPYVNIFTGKYFPPIIDWVAFIILFKPSKYVIVKLGLLTLLIASIFAVIRITRVEEILGAFSYVAIGTFVLLRIFED